MFNVHVRVHVHVHDMNVGDTPCKGPSSTMYMYVTSLYRIQPVQDFSPGFGAGPNYIYPQAVEHVKLGQGVTELLFYCLGCD